MQTIPAPHCQCFEKDFAPSRKINSTRLNFPIGPSATILSHPDSDLDFLPVILKSYGSRVSFPEYGTEYIRQYGSERLPSG
jgi:hypothetical protein